jgi:hypothetical protein
MRHLLLRSLVALACFGVFSLHETSAALKPDQTDTPNFSDTPFRLLHLPETWVFHVSIVVSAVIVLAYIFLSGLTSAIYNEVLQFFLIVAGFAPLVFLGLKNVGGWSGLKANLPPAFMLGPAWAARTPTRLE